MKPVEKPFSPACERNQQAILAVLQEVLQDAELQLLEVGSGTGQHAVFFGRHLPNITWQTSDVADNHAGINKWLDEAQLKHVLPPLEYQIGQQQWPTADIDVVFSANTLHIISIELVQQLIDDMGKNLQAGTRVVFYGPFKYQGAFTSESNAQFDLWLKDIDPQRGIRDFETIKLWMGKQGFILQQDINMPANNQVLLFEKHK